MQFEIASRTDIGKVRSQNQDAMLVRPDLGLFVVADGMGGEKAGEEASAQVIKTVEGCLGSLLHSPGGTPSTVQQALCQALVQANADVVEIGRKNSDKRGLGSTATALCLRSGLAIVAHVGDSRLYLIRGRRARQLTRDHTIVWQLFECGAISRTELEIHPERHLLTQCIGDPRSVQVEAVQERLEPGDMFLICSDGLTGYANEDMLFRVLETKELGLAAKAERIVAMALEGGGGDNVTAILIQVGELDPEDNWEPDATSITLTQDASQTLTAATDGTTPFLESTWSAEERKVRIWGRRAITATIMLIVVLAALLLFALHLNNANHLLKH